MLKSITRKIFDKLLAMGYCPYCITKLRITDEQNDERNQKCMCKCSRIFEYDKETQRFSLKHEQ